MAKPALAPWRLYSGRTLSPQVRALARTSFLQDVASEMVYPLLPAFLLRLGGGALALGAMESVAEGVLALVKGWAGRESDRRGRRRPFILWGYGLSAATRPLLALAATALHVVLLRVADRLAKGLRTAPRDALIADHTAPAQRGFAFSYHRGLDHLGAAAGPLVAALVLALSPGDVRLVFALATVPALLGVANVALRVHERAPGEAPARAGGERQREGEAAGEPGPRGGARDAAVAPAETPGAHTVASAAATDSPPAAAVPPHAHLPRALRAPLLAFFLFALGNASDAFLLLRASAAGLGPLGLTLLWSGFHVAKWAASAPSGRLADRWGPRRPLLLGWAIYGAVYLGFGHTDSLAALALLLLPYALYYGLTEGAERALVAALAEPAGRGTALGAYHLASGLGSLVASLLFGAIWEAVSPAAAFGTGAALALVAAAVLLATSPPAARSALAN